MQQEQQTVSYGGKENDRALIIKGEGMARGQSVVIKELPLNKIKLSRNSRLGNSGEDLSGLMQSINSTGLLEPIGVVETKDGKGYEIAYGNRRFMAFSKLGLHSIPCIIHKRRNDNDVDVKNLTENVQRRNISLAEIGRYASILEGEGLGKKELAVRMGVPVNYIESCLEAFKEVPKEYREDLETNMHSKKKTPGKISIHAARTIINATKSSGVTKAQTKSLFEAAKSDERFTPENVTKYVAAIKRGAKDPIGDIKPVKKVGLNMLIDEGHYEKLMRQYVYDGPFNSFTALVKAVCRGQKQVVINFME